MPESISYSIFFILSYSYAMGKFIFKKIISSLLHLIFEFLYHPDLLTQTNIRLFPALPPAPVYCYNYSKRICPAVLSCSIIPEESILPWKKEADVSSGTDVLYKERGYDLQRILDYILEFEILGVNAVWDAGKTFVANQLKRNPEVQKQFEIIQIDLLSCNLDLVVCW